MPANSIASAVALEAIPLPTMPAAPQPATAVTQTFNSLLGNLIDDGAQTPAAQPVAIKKQPTDPDTYTAQLMTNQQPAQPPQPILIPAAVLRMHFYFPATPSAKAPDTKSEDVNEGTGPTPNQPISTSIPAPVTVILPSAPVPSIEPQPVLAQPAPAPQQATKPASGIQTSNSQVPVQPILVPPVPIQPIPVPQTTTQQAAMPQTAPILRAPVPVSNRRTARPDDSGDDTPQATAPSQNPPQPTQLLIPTPQVPVPQSSAPQSPQPNAPADPQTGTSAPIAQTSTTPAPLRTPQNSPKENLNLSLKDSQTPQFSVNPEGAAPMHQAELAFAAKLTVRAPAQPQPEHLQTTPSPTNSLTAASKTTFAPAPPTAPIAPVQMAQSGQQADTNTGGDPSPDPRPLAKAPAKVQVEGQSPVTEAPVIQKAQVPAQSVTSTPSTMPISPMAEVVNTPATVKTANEPASQPIDSRPDAAALPQTNIATKAEPVRDLSIRIGDNPGNQVDVKIQERAGEVHVSVLSNSSSMTTDLREQVGDLVGKLDRAGYHAETFKPGSPMQSQQTSNQSDANQQHSSAGGQQQQQEDARQQFLGRQKRSNQSQWLQQMNGNFGPVAVEGIEN